VSIIDSGEKPKALTPLGSGDRPFFASAILSIVLVEAKRRAYLHSQSPFQPRAASLREALRADVLECWRVHP